MCPEEHKTDVAVFHQNLAAVHDALVRQNRLILVLLKAFMYMYMIGK